jgi:hypothetical protein
MAAATITIKLSPREYAQVKRFLGELREAKVDKAKHAHPADPKTRHELNQDVLALNELLGHI